MGNHKPQNVYLILLEIAILKCCLDKVSQRVDSLSDPVLVVVSQMLDDRLNQYAKQSMS